MRLSELPIATRVLTGAAGAAALLSLACLLPISLFIAGSANTLAPLGAEPAMPSSDRRPLEAYAAIYQRPLFNPGRAMDPQGAQTAKPGMLPLDSYRLVGVVLTKDVKIGLVERRDSKQVVSLHPGDDLDGRHVDDVVAAGIKLSGGTAEEILTIPRATPKPPAR
jgi:hypothetical protein